MRKSPIKHYVRTHKKGNKIVKSYVRGHGQKSSKITKPTLKLSSLAPIASSSLEVADVTQLMEREHSGIATIQKVYDELKFRYGKGSKALEMIQKALQTKEIIRTQKVSPDYLSRITVGNGAKQIWDFEDKIHKTTDYGELNRLDEEAKRFPAPLNKKFAERIKDRWNVVSY